MGINCQHGLPEHMVHAGTKADIDNFYLHSIDARAISVTRLVFSKKQSVIDLVCCALFNTPCHRFYWIGTCTQLALQTCGNRIPYCTMCTFQKERPKAVFFSVDDEVNATQVINFLK